MASPRRHKLLLSPPQPCFFLFLENIWAGILKKLVLITLLTLHLKCPVGTVLQSTLCNHLDYKLKQLVARQMPMSIMNYWINCSCTEHYSALKYSEIKANCFFSGPSCWSVTHSLCGFLLITVAVWYEPIVHFVSHSGVLQMVLSDSWLKIGILGILPSRWEPTGEQVTSSINLGIFSQVW